jgi:predicted PurR-regulated permease PerM
MGGQTVIALCDASLITLGALLLGVPNAGAVFMLTFVGAYIPYIGAFISGLLAVLLAVHVLLTLPITSSWKLPASSRSKDS